MGNFAPLPWSLRVGKHPGPNRVNPDLEYRKTLVLLYKKKVFYLCHFIADCKHLNI